MCNLPTRVDIESWHCETALSLSVDIKNYGDKLLVLDIYAVSTTRSSKNKFNQTLIRFGSLI